MKVCSPAFRRKGGPPKGGTTYEGMGICMLVHSHDLVAAVDVDGLTGDGGGAVAGQEGAGFAEFFSGDVAFEGGVGFVMFEHIGEAGDAAGGEGVDGAGADAVDADFLWAEIVS